MAGCLLKNNFNNNSQCHLGSLCSMVLFCDCPPPTPSSYLSLSFQKATLHKDNTSLLVALLAFGYWFYSQLFVCYLSILPLKFYWQKIHLFDLSFQTCTDLARNGQVMVISKDVMERLGDGVPKIANRRNHQGADTDANTRGFITSSSLGPSGAGTWTPRWVSV